MSAIHRKGFEHATSRPHKAAPPWITRVLSGPDVKSSSMIPRVAWWRAFRALFDEPWTTFLGIIQLDARNLALIRPKNSADRCKRAPRRSQSLFLSSAPSSSLRPSRTLSPSNFGQPATIVSRDKRDSPPKGIPSNLDYESNCKRYRFFD